MKCSYKGPQATAVLKGGNMFPNIIGTVDFYQKKSCVLVVAHIRNLPRSAAGFFGFHIHEGFSCGGTDFSDTKSHFNPALHDHPEHAGDMPPLILCGTTAYLSFLTDRYQIEQILGRTIVIHDMPDDFISQPAGNSGQKIACGIIKKP